jgi:hypothetical protein
LEWPGAEAAYRAALAANPNNEAVHRYYAVFLAARGRSESAALENAPARSIRWRLTVNSQRHPCAAGDYETAVDGPSMRWDGADIRDRAPRSGVSRAA